MSEANGFDDISDTDKKSGGEEVIDDKVDNTPKEKKEDDVETSADITEENVSGMSDLEKQIIRQIEYYFGNYNLPRDKFLQEQIKLDDGWVPMDIMLKFNRLSSISSDVDVILTAISKSSAKLIEISEDRKKIRRATDKPLPEMNDARRSEIQTRTVYCKGFHKKDTTLDALLEYFNQFGSIDNIQMRYYRDKAIDKSTFKGSIFATFDTREKAEEFLKKDSVKYKDVELIRKWQTEYLKEKRDEWQERRDAKKKKDKSKDNKKDSSDKEDEQGEGADGDKEEKEEKYSFPKGAILHLTGFTGEITREDIKEKLGELDANVAFVDFKKGDSEGWIRLEEENSAATVVEKVKEEGKLEICGTEISVMALEGEEEEQFLIKTKVEIEKRRQYASRNKRGGRRGGRSRGFGGRDFRGQKRRGSPIRDGPPSKKK